MVDITSPGAIRGMLRVHFLECIRQPRKANDDHSPIEKEARAVEMSM